MRFRWRQLAGRPPIALDVFAVGREAWRLFGPHHYLSGELTNSAQCYVAEADGTPAAFVAMRFQPLSRAPCWMVHRLVTLPEWQGVGVGTALLAEVAREYQERPPRRVRIVTRHRGLVLALARSPLWRCVRPMGSAHGQPRSTSVVARRSARATARGEISASFEWRGMVIGSRQ